MSNKALLVMDLQKDLCYDERRKGKVLEMLPSLQKAIALFNENKSPIYYTCFSLKQDDEQFEKYGDSYCIENTEGAEIIPELYPLKGEVIYKLKHSAFSGTALNELLKKDSVEEVYLTGLQTHICILTTAAEAHHLDYKAIAISDCVVSSNSEKKKWALEWIGEHVGKVKNLNEVQEDFLNEK